MAIGTDAAVDYFGDIDTLGTGSAEVTNGSYSIAGDLSTWTNDDNARSAFVTLLANFSTNPDAGSGINLYLRLLNIEGANDAEIPSDNMQQGFVGTFLLNAVTTAQHPWLNIQLPNSKSSQEYEYYIKVAAGQTLPAGWDIFVGPKAVGPQA